MMVFVTFSGLAGTDGAALADEAFVARSQLTVYLLLLVCTARPFALPLPATTSATATRRLGVRTSRRVDDSRHL